MTVTRVQHGPVAVLTIDNSPVNALGQAVRARLCVLAQEVNADPAVRAVVLMGAGRLFVGGADISEFDHAPQPPHLPELLELIETATKPWVAAIHGTALGGGLELALACHYRVAAPGSRFALPEVTLGIIPGAGGTQRLPRLIGVEAALPIVTEKQTLDSSQALTTRLVSEVIDGPLMERAIEYAKQIMTDPLPLPARSREVNDPGSDFWRDAEARISRTSKGLSAPLLALRALRIGVESGFAQGLTNERETFLRLRAGTEAAALRYLFFAERSVMRPSDLRDVTPLPLNTVGVVGGGTMGVGIAAAIRNAGLPVILSERNEDALARSLSALNSLFEGSAKRGSISNEDVKARMDGVTGIVGLEGMNACDLVIEAVFEELSVKREVFAELDKICRRDTLFATNTSYLDPKAIATRRDGQDRFIGLHFFSPAHIMRLLEIVPLPETSRPVLSTAYALANRMNKVAVRSGICEGFIGNRILKKYRAVAEGMVADGVPHADIDAAMRSFGYAMGPFEMQDLAGLDIAFLHREAARARGEFIPETLGDLLVRAGRKGQKTGGGWYDYTLGDRTPRLSADVARLLAPRISSSTTLSGQAIATSLVAAMAAEGQAILDEGIAATPQDVDLVQVHGYGFPRAKGGPMFMATHRAPV